MYITQKDYVDKAERVITSLVSRYDKRTVRNVPLLTTSKIRSLLSLSSDIYNELLNQQGDNLSEDMLGRIAYLKVRFIYEAGRDKDGHVKDFVEKANILKIVDQIGNSKKNYILFNRYMEALVAYHKFYGGKD